VPEVSFERIGPTARLGSRLSLLPKHRKDGCRVFPVCLAKTSYTCKMNDLAKIPIRTVPIRFLP
jgi:hypothetical protein